MSTPGGTEEPARRIAATDEAEAAEAAYEFAVLIQREAARREARQVRPENYEVRPCNGVRGYTLRLPVLGWRLWYPTAIAAADFARRVSVAYRAECFVYDASGQLTPHPL